MGSFGISIFSNGLIHVVVFFSCCFLLYSFSMSSLPTVCEYSLLACSCAPCPDSLTHLCLPVCESPSLAHLLPILTYPPICAIQFVSPPHLLTCSTPCPDLPTHLCLPVCESPLLTLHSNLPIHLCFPVYESPLLTHLLPVLTFPFILAFQFVSAPCLDCSLACICTIFLYRNAHSCCSHMYYNTPLQ